MIRKSSIVFSNFFVPLFIIVINNLDVNSKDDPLFIFWLALFLLSFVCSVCFAIIFKNGSLMNWNHDKNIFKNGSLMNWNHDKIIIKNSKYNIHIFEYWFLIISPCILFDGTNCISSFGIIVIFFIVFIILYSQNIFIFNIILIILGYNFTLIEYEQIEYILCSKLNETKLQTAIADKDSKIYLVNDSSYLYIKSNND